MRKVRNVFVIVLILMVSVLSLVGCNESDNNNTNTLDESDNNIRGITIETLSNVIMDNPYQVDKKHYDNEGRLINRSMEKYGKNALSIYYEQNDRKGVVRTFLTVFGRLPSNNVYDYTHWTYMIEPDVERRGYIDTMKRAEKSKKIFEEQLEHSKISMLSGFFFEGCHNYLVEIGDEIYKVADGMVETYGRLSAESWGALGVGTITKSAETLKIIILDNNDVEISYMWAGGDELMVLNITGLGKNYIIEDEYRGYFEQIEKTDEFINLMK